MHSPRPSDLQNLFQMSQSHPGELIELCWVLDTIIFTLTACRPAPTNQAKGIMNRKTLAPADTEWTLRTQASANSVHEQAWTHATADLELISNLLSILPGSKTAPNQITQFTSNPAPRVTEQYQMPAAQPASQFPQAPNQESAQANPQQKPDSAGGMVLSGDLCEVDLTGILQSIALLRMTGCLGVHDRLDEVTLYFDDGVLVHAHYESSLSGSTTATGDRVLLELLLWEAGKFNFKHGKKVPEKTVNRRLESLLMEGTTLKDYWKHLHSNGLDMETPVSRIRTDLSKEQFDSIVSQGLPIDLSLQQQVYLEINGKRSLYDIISKFGMTRAVWVPLIFNLQNSQLIKFGTRQGTNEVQITTSLFDQMRVNHARNSLVRIESGMMSYDLFIHYLQLEFERVRKHPQHHFSVTVFSIHDQQTKEPLSVLSISKITESIEQLKDTIDILAHYREHDFIILGPYRDAQKSAAQAERIANMLKQGKIEGIQNIGLKFGFGIASFPQCTDIVQLLTSAEEAKQKAMNENSLIVIHQ